ncbi:hypothetical protein GW17_00032817, partial [Ensete ventricosum]
VINNGNYINNEFSDVYLVTTLSPIPMEAFTLQVSNSLLFFEVSSVKYIQWKDYKNVLEEGEEQYVPYDVTGQYGQLFIIIEQSGKARTARYIPVRQLTGTRIGRYRAVPLKSVVGGRLKEKLTVGGRLRKKKGRGRRKKKRKRRRKKKRKSISPARPRCLQVACERRRPRRSWLAATFLSARETFCLPARGEIEATLYGYVEVVGAWLQVWHSNPMLRDWLKERSNTSSLDRLKWMYYSINKSPCLLVNNRSSLDENEAFLTTADSAVKLLAKSMKPVSGWEGIEYRAAFPVMKPPGANFYPPDMDKEKQRRPLLFSSSPQTRRRKNAVFSLSDATRRRGGGDVAEASPHLLHSLKTSKAVEVSGLRKERCEEEDEPSPCPYLLDRDRRGRAAPNRDALRFSLFRFLLPSPSQLLLSLSGWSAYRSADGLDSKLDVTIGPYETYEDTLFGYKATFEAFVGIRDDIATSQVKLFGDHLQFHPLNVRKVGIIASLVYFAVGTYCLTRFAISICTALYGRYISVRQIIGTRIARYWAVPPKIDRRWSISVVGGLLRKKKGRKRRGEEIIPRHPRSRVVTRVRRRNVSPHGEPDQGNELQELHSALEEAKADIVGLWALKFLIDQVTGMQTARYRAVPPKLTVVGRFRPSAGEKGKKKKRKRRKKKKRRRKKTFPRTVLARAPSPPASRSRAVLTRSPLPPAGCSRAVLTRGGFFSHARRRNVSPRREKDRGDVA